MLALLFSFPTLYTQGFFKKCDGELGGSLTWPNKVIQNLLKLACFASRIYHHPEFFRNLFFFSCFLVSRYCPLKVTASTYSLGAWVSILLVGRITGIVFKIFSGMWTAKIKRRRNSPVISSMERRRKSKISWWNRKSKGDVYERA